MKLTEEQHKIINSIGNIRINAVAGSGKTTTVIEYAASRPKDAKILYLAFNKSVKTEALQKFEKKGLTNVKVETAHSLAYWKIVRKYNYKVCPGYKSHELVSLLDLYEEDERHGVFILANHINKLVSFYCNSDAESVFELEYLKTIVESKAKGFVTKYINIIQEKADLLIEKMDRGEINVTHDFYLKKFQLSFPKLEFDYILFDEGQDASAAMLDIFLSQDATKVIVGDTHQQIYSWRYAINSLEKVDFQTFNLSTSFRFNSTIAHLASKTLDLKKLVIDFESFPIQGLGTCNTLETKAILARTNLGLLLNAIEYVVKDKNAAAIYFEGNLSSYTYAVDGASLFDVLNLFEDKKHLIKNVIIKRMHDLEDLEEYTKQTEDVELALMVEIVKKYGKKVPDILNEIRAKHIKTDNKAEAEIIFSTVHRSKGMEYDKVKLAHDFIDKDKIQFLQDEFEGQLSNTIIEEINLLYVAITRTKNLLHIPENFLPDNFEEAECIVRLPAKKQDSERIDANSHLGLQIIKKHPNSFQPWTPEHDNLIRSSLRDGLSIKAIANNLQRSTNSIRTRMKALNL
jgi:superfamily I DNA/RNA helicase